jgi:hypothetical protein
MSSSYSRRERRMNLKFEKKLMDKHKLRIPTPEEVEEYIKNKAAQDKFNNKMNELNKTIENG